MLARTIRLCLTVLSLAAAYGQESPAPRFEVASFKIAPSPAELRASGQASPRPILDAVRFRQYTTLELLIRQAYRLESYQAVTGPEWMATTWIDLNANLPAGSTRDQIPAMLQALLAERLKLTVHSTSQEITVYHLTLGPGGPKLKEAAPDALPSAKWAPVNPAQILVLRTATATGALFYSRLNGTVVMDANKITVAELASLLRKEVGQPVFDKTGLKGFYEVSLPVPAAWLQTLAPPRDPSDTFTQQASDPSGVNIFRSLEKLGLRLDKVQAKVDGIVIDHLEKTPTEN